MLQLDEVALQHESGATQAGGLQVFGTTRPAAKDTKCNVTRLATQRVIALLFIATNNPLLRTPGAFSLKSAFFRFVYAVLHQFHDIEYLKSSSGP